MTSEQEFWTSQHTINIKQQEDNHKDPKIPTATKKPEVYPSIEVK